MTTPYQPAPGIWRSSPERTLLWAVTAALHRIEREIPETKNVTKWRTRLEKAIYGPVKRYAWTKLWTAKHLRKDNDGDPDVPAEIEKEWAKIVETITSQAGLWWDAAETRAAALDLPFDADAMEAGFESTFHLVKQIPDTLRDRLRSVMREAYQQQSGPQAFARAIRDEFDALSKAKAEQIAETEWNRAASQATLNAYQKQGVERVVWITLGDSRVCEICENNAADGEIAIGSAFFSGDQAPPAHPSCRCSLSSA